VISILEQKVLVNTNTRENSTHDHLLSATVISSLQDGRIKIIEVEFPLKCELVIEIKDVERECCLRSLERRGVPAYAQKLAIVLDPLRTLCACAELYVDVVNSADVDHEDGLSFRAR